MKYTVHHNVLSKPNLESKTDFKLMVAQQSGKAKSKSVQMVLKKTEKDLFCCISMTKNLKSYKKSNGRA